MLPSWLDDIIAIVSLFKFHAMVQGLWKLLLISWSYYTLLKTCQHHPSPQWCLAGETAVNGIMPQSYAIGFVKSLLIHMTNLEPIYFQAAFLSMLGTSLYLIYFVSNEKGPTYEVSKLQHFWFMFFKFLNNFCWQSIRAAFFWLSRTELHFAVC